MCLLPPAVTAESVQRIATTIAHARVIQPLMAPPQSVPGVKAGEECQIFAIRSTQGAGLRWRGESRPADRPQAALQVLRADPGGVLGHRCAGHRLLRALSPLLRRRARGIPPPPRAA